MRRVLTTAHLLALLLLTGCGGSESSEQIETVEDIPELSTQFSPLPNYAFEDFSFGDNVQYWELKTGPEEEGDENCPVESAWRYDEAQYAALSDEQRAGVDAAVSASGFQSGVQLPCVVFGVAVIGAETELLTTHAELLGFLGDIDAEAKLNMWLWANDYNGLTYEMVDGGYEAIAMVADPMCKANDYFRVYIDTAGVITEVDKLATLEPSACA